MKVPKQERQRALVTLLEEDPFLTDEDLARHFSVSIQTVRLDRLECQIPELRERLKSVASQQMQETVKSIQAEEIFGEIIDVELDNKALSIFDVTEAHVFKRNGIARGHHLFAQANSLAVAVLDDDLALTVRSSLHFQKPVRAGDRVVARATVREETLKNKSTVVDVLSTVEGEPVFSGEFSMYRTTKKGR
ncbi:fatty acid biosynthesis transcriptional regulator [Sporosarcina sp. P37]|uniref:transcription factor FapR n=1 Tax=unclassified Sporosarcina TaxID=2647733 RepID=UPI0009BD76B9|nr:MULTISPECIES: transcription factor FapR [unclassified Sporosarcina]ARD49262.1 fatty acid biosynthesis transcriptional regulator [Sporosarcina sp. P33]ARK25736.1 fatty acid biosynthesis transcriptional regulator [Sporosarcina sp. P37]PID19240.1 transcription factor FapR [Sporosarcina sp. P35]